MDRAVLLVYLDVLVQSASGVDIVKGLITYKIGMPLEVTFEAITDEVTFEAITDEVTLPKFKPVG